MKFKYIDNTPDAPKTTKVSGYIFQLEGESVDVKEALAIEKLLGMKHAGFVPFEEGDRKEESSEKDLAEKIKDLVLAKTYEELKAYKEKHKIQCAPQIKALQSAIIKFLIAQETAKENDVAN